MSSKKKTPDASAAAGSTLAVGSVLIPEGWQRVETGKLPAFGDEKTGAACHQSQSGLESQSPAKKW